MDRVTTGLCRSVSVGGDSARDRDRVLLKNKENPLLCRLMSRVRSSVDSRYVLSIVGTATTSTTSTNEDDEVVIYLHVAGIRTVQGPRTTSAPCVN